MARAVQIKFGFERPTCIPIAHPRAAGTPGLWIEYRGAWQVRSHYVRLQLWVAWAAKHTLRDRHEFCFGKTRRQARTALFDRLDQIDRTP